MLRRRSLLHGASAGLILAGCGTPVAPPDTDDAFVAELQERAFRWFWDVTPHETGLTPDRWPTRAFCSVAAVGFALTAYGVGVARGWVGRTAAAERTLNTMRFLHAARQGPEERGVSGHRGFFYHFLDLDAGARFQRVELSSIDTTLLLGGVLFAQSFFDSADAQEREIARLADEIYARVEWTWMRPRPPRIAMGWHAENGGAFIDSDWRIYDEAALLYVLALGSPTHAIEPEAWTAWTSSFDAQWGTHWGQTYLHYPPAFIHQYSQVWLDLKGLQDDYMRGKGIDYFENSRRAIYAQQAYAIENPGAFADYGAEIFGLTACDGPGDFTREIEGRARQFFGYSARGPGGRDDGTLAPTALGGAIPFAPEITIPALSAMRRRYGDAIYSQYGFRDAFNPTLRDPAAPINQGRILGAAGWVDDDYLGIDQGPIVCMIENWRSGLVWRVMRRNAHVRRGLERAGFRGGWLQA